MNPVRFLREGMVNVSGMGGVSLPLREVLRRRIRLRRVSRSLILDWVWSHRRIRLLLTDKQKDTRLGLF